MTAPATLKGNDSTTGVATPFLKWAGGKSQLLPELTKQLPPKFGRYFEPFVGGGALFFHLHAAGLLRHGATLGDSNADLVNAYAAIRGDVEPVVRRLAAYARLYVGSEAARKRYFKRVRSGRIAAAHKSALAARVIFLNRTGYNGLYRVNRKGQFNVPHGRNGNPTICDKENLRACAKALRRVRLISGDFEKASRDAKRGDFWYADPPYVPRSATSDFTAYTKDPFGPNEQERLRDLALALKKRGVHVLLSNSDTPLVRKLYAKGFSMRRVKARRNINSVTAKRGHVRELLIW
jgi:DNA adenine methylase